ncbi:MAG: MOSC domain-containing protein [Proteobacteria bacterium]|nr:MOSC domain-containing protein [Pseudomonadota bacterium]MBU1710206.1 MOSC domain-containing protein [Pseudomonadota bacterium]
MGKILSLNISTKKGTGKKPVETIAVRPDHGMQGDAHAGDWHRQISLLAMESINKMIEKGLELVPGDFAENITTQGLDVASLPVGTRLVSDSVELEITQIGKKCHSKCDIFAKVGDCIMPREGVFAKVITAGTLTKNAKISIKE